MNESINQSLIVACDHSLSIVLYSSIYIAPLNSHGQTEALLVRLAPSNNGKRSRHGHGQVLHSYRGLVTKPRFRTVMVHSTPKEWNRLPLHIFLSLRNSSCQKAVQ